MSEEIVPGTLYVVSTPIGNLGDITRRAVEVLSGVNCIAAEDTRTTRVLLDHLAIRKRLVSHFSYNERQRVPTLLKDLHGGASVAVVTDAGTPGISDPAHLLIRRALEEKINVVPVPGASAFLTALVISGLPTDRFVFEGFLPVKKGRATRLGRLAGEERTIILYESPHRVERTLRDLLQHIGDRRIALARELTKKFEEVFRGRLSEAAEHLAQTPPRGEYVLVIAGSSYRDENRDRHAEREDARRPGDQP